MDAMLDIMTSIVIMTILSFLIILILTFKKKIKVKTAIMIFINSFLFILYFNWMFPYIPVYDYHPYDWSEFYWMGQFFKWTDYFSDIEMTKIIIKENLSAAIVFIGISVINVIAFKEKYTLLKNFIISIFIAIFMLLFPLAVNIYWGGVVWIINTIAPIIIIIYFFFGYFIGKVIMRLYNSLFKDIDREALKEKN